MSYRDAVEGIIEAPDVRGRGWLAIVDEVRTLSAEQTRQLTRGALSIPALRIMPTRRIFNEAAAKSFFNSLQWVPVSVSIEELREVMRGVVSSEARRVALSPFLVNLLKLEVKLVTDDDMILALERSLGGEENLAAIDLKRKAFACHCDEYEASSLCKHVLLAFFHGRDAILEGRADADEWREAFKRAQQHKHSRTMLSNWFYYFIKHYIAPSCFAVGKYESLSAVEGAVCLLRDQSLRDQIRFSAK
jgi:hypothetical protein